MYLWNLGASQEKLLVSGAWYYFRLLNTDANPTDSEQKQFLKKQFWYFHGWKRYGPPLILVIVLSGLVLAFTGLWLAEFLSSKTF